MTPGIERGPEASANDPIELAKGDILEETVDNTKVKDKEGAGVVKINPATDNFNDIKSIRRQKMEKKIHMDEVLPSRMVVDVDAIP